MTLPLVSVHVATLVNVHAIVLTAFSQILSVDFVVQCITYQFNLNNLYIHLYSNSSIEFNNNIIMINRSN